MSPACSRTPSAKRASPAVGVHVFAAFVLNSMAPSISPLATLRRTTRSDMFSPGPTSARRVEVAEVVVIRKRSA